MTRIIADISVSLDGFVTGPGPSPDNGLGTGGEALHTWAFPDDRLHLAPIVLGAGTPVLTGGAPRRLVQRRVISASAATHLTYDVFR